MKAKFSILLLTVFFAHAAMAQFHIGVKAGANITKIEGKSFDQEFKYGYSLGGFAEIGVGSKFAIQPEVLYNQSKASTDSSFRNVYQNAFKTSNNITLNYLTIPVLLNYKLIGNTVTLQAGPQFGILLNKDQTLLQNGQQAFKHGDFAMLGGVQVKLLGVRVSGRYVVGLNNINELGDENKWKSRGLQFSVGIGL